MWLGVEARGFIFGAALAYKMGAGFVPVRKKGKLPYKTKSVTYKLGIRQRYFRNSWKMRLNLTPVF